MSDISTIKEIQWDGSTITKPGVYVGIPIETYHNDPALLDGPSVSKSSLKSILPTHGGSPKAFWGRWHMNPNRIKGKRNKALDFGKLVHCCLLGDEVFDKQFVVRPEKAPDGRDWHAANKSCVEWVKDHKDLTIVTKADMEIVRRISDDAKKYPLIEHGLLDGAVERTFVYKDQQTGIWVRSRPDVVPADTIFSDLKTASDFDEEFLQRQLFDNFYYGQAAMIRMACRELKIPFETFVFMFVLNDDVPDTTHAEISPFDMDRGEREIRWALNTIRKCLDSGDWTGARPFAGGERLINMKSWSAEKIDRFLELEEHNFA